MKEKEKDKKKNKSGGVFGKEKAKDDKKVERWLLVDAVKGSLASKTISEKIKELDQRKGVADKEVALFPNQRKQLNDLLDRLNSQTDPDFTWTLAQIERKEKEKSSKSKKRQTISITFYLKRAPLRM